MSLYLKVRTNIEHLYLNLPLSFSYYILSSVKEGIPSIKWFFMMEDKSS